MDAISFPSSSLLRTFGCSHPALSSLTPPSEHTITIMIAATMRWVVGLGEDHQAGVVEVLSFARPAPCGDLTPSPRCRSRTPPLPRDSTRHAAVHAQRATPFLSNFNHNLLLLMRVPVTSSVWLFSN